MITMNIYLDVFSLFDPRCHWLYIVAPRCKQMKPDDCSWAKLAMVVSRCMQMSLSDPRCTWLDVDAWRWVYLFLDALNCT